MLSLCCAEAFSCGRSYSLAAVRGFSLWAHYGASIVGASLVMEHGFWGFKAASAVVSAGAWEHGLEEWAHRLSGMRAWFQGMWNLPDQGLHLCPLHRPVDFNDWALPRQSQWSLERGPLNAARNTDRRMEWQLSKRWFACRSTVGFCLFPHLKIIIPLGHGTSLPGLPSDWLWLWGLSLRLPILTVHWVHLSSTWAGLISGLPWG